MTKMQNCVDAVCKKKADPADIRRAQATFAELVKTRYASQLRSLKDEIFKIGGGAEKKEAKARLRKFKDRKRKMEQTMDMMRQNQNREDLSLGGGAGRGFAAQKATNDEIMSEALRINNGDVNTMQELVGVVQDTTQQAEATAAQMHEQTEQIERINQSVHGFRGTVARGGKLLHTYKRRLQTDRAIWCFLFLIVAAIVGLVIWTMVDPDGASQVAAVPEQAVPPTPERVQEEVGGRRRLRGW